MREGGGVEGVCVCVCVCVCPSVLVHVIHTYISVLAKMLTIIQ